MRKPARIVNFKKPVFFPIYNSCHAGNICISKTVRCSVTSKPVSTLINSYPVKSFVSGKTVCFSNVSVDKEFNSVNPCLITCTEHPVNFISSVLRKSIVSYRTACPDDFDVAVINPLPFCSLNVVFPSKFVIPFLQRPFPFRNFHYV